MKGGEESPMSHKKDVMRDKKTIKTSLNPLSDALGFFPSPTDLKGKFLFN